MTIAVASNKKIHLHISQENQVPRLQNLTFFMLNSTEHELIMLTKN